MPVSRIAIRKFKSPTYKQALMEAVYEAMREAVHIKEGIASRQCPNTMPRNLAMAAYGTAGCRDMGESLLAYHVISYALISS
jgi:hypothetical protein